MAKPIFKIEKSDTGNRFSMAGDINAQYAQELKTFLIQGVALADDIHLALDQITSIDTSAVQLTYAFKKEIEKQHGRKLTLSLPGTESVRDLLTKTGITKIL